jgi:signal peptidase I
LESFLDHSSVNDTSLNENIALMKVVLESGNSVELPASGYSMFPTLRPGDKVVVKPLAKEELPLTGSVIVCMDNGASVQGCYDAMVQTEKKSLVMHRLIEMIADDSGKILYFTRGDSGKERDKPWPQQQLLGVAKSYRRGKKEHSIKTFVPGVWRYLFNHRLLWIFNKIMQLTRIP